MRDLEFGDMVFYAVTGLILILLFWLRFLEATVGLWGAWCLWGFWLLFLIASFVKGVQSKRNLKTKS
jgi:hypothetical protein